MANHWVLSVLQFVAHAAICCAAYFMMPFFLSLEIGGTPVVDLVALVVATLIASAMSCFAIERIFIRVTGCNVRRHSRP